MPRREAGWSKSPSSKAASPEARGAYRGVRERARREERQVCAPEGAEGLRTPLVGFFNTLLGLLIPKVAFISQREVGFTPLMRAFKIPVFLKGNRF